ncbi:lectin subunit alpha [Stomoxys calcitrans]|uniref:C-type lectin domain-containing protein n=1 Tax=Stomoxys calcitrans TaxID=35570 RepID=A0A1I8NYZ1_STOCA|nr:lectin subunit alpha [Stomoxys calcitrans]
MKILIGLCALLTLVVTSPIQKWQRSGDGCPYLIEHEQMFNWFQAWEECLQNNMTLLAVDSSYKHRQITLLLKELFPKNLTYWIGAHDWIRPKQFVWQSTHAAMHFSDWVAGQPNYGSDHCVRNSAAENQWYDSNCHDNYGFICENLQCSNEKNLAYEKSTVTSKYNVHFWNVLGNQKP